MSNILKWLLNSINSINFAGRRFIMKPRLGSTLTNQPSDRREHKTVKHSHIWHNMLHTAFKIKKISLYRSRINLASIIWICSSDQISINDSKSITALIFRPRKEEAVHCGDSKIQIQKPVGPKFTSCVFVRHSSNPGLDKPELRPKKKPDSCLHR